MKPTLPILKTISITLLTACATSRAASWIDNIYLHTDIGPSFIQNTTLHDSGIDVRSGQPQPFRRSGTAKFDTQIRGDLSLGYNITKALAVELEAGVIWDPTTPAPDEFYQIPVTLNALYQVPLNRYWNLYFGAGAGEVVTVFQTLLPDPTFHVPFHLKDTSVALGYQAEAGIKYAVSRHVEIGLGYKFLGVEENTWNLNAPFFREKLTIQNLYNHTALLSFNWKF